MFESVGREMLAAVAEPPCPSREHHPSSALRMYHTVPFCVRQGGCRSSPVAAPAQGRGEERELMALTADSMQCSGETVRQ